MTQSRFLEAPLVWQADGELKNYNFLFYKKDIMQLFSADTKSFF